MSGRRATAVKAVQVQVSQLRKLLDEDALETRPTGYLLRVEPGALDLQRFESLLERGRERLGEGDATAAGELLREALGLWRGSPLAEFEYEAFARNEIGRLEELRLAALELRLEADLALGRHTEVVGELEGLVRDHPLRESLARLLILALYRAGRQADALAVIAGRARDAASTSSASTPARRCSSSRSRSCSRTPRSTRSAAIVQRTHRRRPRRPRRRCRHRCARTAARQRLRRRVLQRVRRAARGDDLGETRKTVTVLFCDVVGFTALGEDARPRGAAARDVALLRARAQRRSSGTAARWRSSSATR